MAKYGSGTGVIAAVCISPRKHEKKTDVGGGVLKEDWGIEGDAHAGPGTRQVSLLAVESIRKMEASGRTYGFGVFAENITTQGIDLTRMHIGERLHLGDTAVVEVTRIGKECAAPCAIQKQAGFCVMPTDGIFAVVVRGGFIRTGDPILLEPAGQR
jgi:molybdopterin adenylyltransferase